MISLLRFEKDLLRMYESEHKVSKVRLEVEVELNDGARLLGSLFIKQMQRISDLLNDNREFLPFQTANGLIIHLRKSTITKVSQLDQVVDVGVVNDPYEVLGVSPRIGDEDLRRAYHELCARHHPDKLVSLGLATEYIDLANSRIVRVIDAYDRIKKQRHGEAETEQRHASYAAR
jgi:DnaJ-domain-containing protein 1